MPMAMAARKVSVPAAILLVLSVLSCLFLVHAAAAGNRRALLPREAPGSGVLPTTAEEAAIGAWEPHHHQLADEETTTEDETEAAARRAGLLQTQDYPGSGANSRHDPRNPH